MHRHAMAALLALMVPLIAASGTEAATSDWVSSEGGRMRLAAVGEAADGKVRAIVDIEPAAGWKTYWRDPGDAGMPPEIDISASDNLTLSNIGFPVPEITDDADGRFMGYHGPARLVLELAKPAPAEPARLKASVFIGICKEICLPFQANFDIDVGPRLDTAEQALTDHALSALPEAPHAGFEVLSWALSANRTTISGEFSYPGQEQPVLLPVPGKGLRFGRPIAIDAKDGRARITIPVKKLPKAPAKAVTTILVKLGEAAMETTLVLE